jgi:hypothetical protein
MLQCMSPLLHLTDMPAHPRWHLGQVNAAGRPYAAPNVRYWGNSGQRRILARDGLSAFDPTATSPVHCGNGFDAGFSPYQSTRLNRYNAAAWAWGLTCNGAVERVVSR